VFVSLGVWCEEVGEGDGTERCEDRLGEGEGLVTAVVRVDLLGGSRRSNN
jgi:hypothetical protein